MAVIIPTENVDQALDLEISLEGVDMLLRFQWIRRLGRWCIDFLQPDETPILLSRVIKPGQVLNNRFTDEFLPSGAFIALRKDGKFTPFGEKELATECDLYFVTQEELLTGENPASGDFEGLTYVNS